MAEKEQQIQTILEEALGLESSDRLSSFRKVFEARRLAIQARVEGNPVPAELQHQIDTLFHRYYSTPQGEEKLPYQKEIRPWSHRNDEDMSIEMSENTPPNAQSNNTTQVTQDKNNNKALRILEKVTPDTKEIKLNGLGLKQLPDNFLAKIAVCRGLTSLNLQDNELEELPPQIGDLSELLELRVDKNRLKELPSTLAQLRKLQRLYAQDNQLPHLPSNLGNLVQLQELHLAKNRLGSLPGSLGSLSNLRQLNLQSNQLTTIPTSLGRLTKLVNLNLGNNHLSTLPESLQRLTALQQMNLQSNQFTELPNFWANFPLLVQLNAKGNQIRILPPSLGNLPQLDMLYLADNRLETIPAELGQLAALTKLYLQNNRLTQLPDELGKLRHLRELWLYGNEITAIPAALSRLPNLKIFLTDSTTPLIRVALSHASKQTTGSPQELDAVEGPQPVEFHSEQEEESKHSPDDIESMLPSPEPLMQNTWNLLKQPDEPMVSVTEKTPEELSQQIQQMQKQWESMQTDHEQQKHILQQELIEFENTRQEFQQKKRSWQQQILDLEKQAESLRRTLLERCRALGISTIQEASAESTAPPVVQELTPESFHRVLEERGLFYDPRWLKRFLIATFAARHVGSLLLQAGSTGTGKTQLFRKAGEILAEAGSEVIPVRPSWLSMSDLLGYVDPIRNLFMPTDFVSAIRQATRKNITHMLSQDAGLAPPFFLLLDELNLARVENFAADLLSVLELPSHDPDRMLRLFPEEVSHLWWNELQHLAAETSHISGGLSDAQRQRIQRCKELKLFFDAAIHMQHAQEQAHILRIPGNLLVCGTLNTDRHTHELSPKVFDRSFILQTPIPQMKHIFNRPHFPADDSSTQLKLTKTPVYALSSIWTHFSHVRERLHQIMEILRPCGLLPSHRLKRNVEIYLWYASIWFTQDDPRDSHGLCGDLLHLFLLPRLDCHASKARTALLSLMKLVEPWGVANDVLKEELTAHLHRAEQSPSGFRGLV